MFKRIDDIDDNSVFDSVTSHDDKFQILMGARVKGLNAKQVEGVWLTCLYVFCHM